MPNTAFNLLEEMVKFKPSERRLEELADGVNKKQNSKDVFDWKKDGVLNWKHTPNAELMGYRIFQQLLDAQRKEAQTAEVARAQGNYGSRIIAFAKGVFDYSHLAKPYVPETVSGKKN